jgi:hypothetical protein
MKIYPLASTGLQQYSHGMCSIMPWVQSSSEYNDLSFIPSRKRSFNHSIFSGYPALFIFLYPQTHIQGYCLHSYQQSLFLPLFIPPINPVAEDLRLCLLMWIRLSPNVPVISEVFAEQSEPDIPCYAMKRSNSGHFMIIFFDASKPISLNSCYVLR